jgi:hypothetical protein
MVLIAVQAVVLYEVLIGSGGVVIIVVVRTKAPFPEDPVCVQKKCHQSSIPKPPEVHQKWLHSSKS